MSDWTASKFMGVVSFSGPTWSEEFPVEKLQIRIEFYERMVGKYGHKTPNYQAGLDALRSIA